MLFHLCNLGLLTLTMAASAFTEPEAHPQLPHVRGHLLVRIDPSQSIIPLEHTAKHIGAERTKSFDLVPGLNLYTFDENRNVEEVRQHFLRHDEVIYAEPDYIYRIEAVVPNDPKFPSQWALDNTGQTLGTPDADINAPEMWLLEKGSKNVVIATIDTGLDYNHSDLVDNVWSNPGEIPGNGVDDDKNGYVDDIHGINAILNTGDPMDDNVHGTHVAGTIGAKGDNNVGVVGVAQTVQIASCKFLSAQGSGGVSDALKCMDYFAKLKSRQQNPVNIVATNNSWGGGGVSQALLDAIKAHDRLGILFIAAAGNSGENNDTVDRYPCNYQVPNVIAVAATDSKDQLATFSSYGRKTVHVAAPGVKILSTVLNQGYGELSGTSMATPHVTGLAAVIAAHYPDYDYLHIKNLIMTSGQKIASTQNTTISGRRIRGADINGVGALSCDNQIVSRRLKPEGSSPKVAVGAQLLLQASSAKCAESLSTLTVYDQNGLQLILQDQGQSGDAIAGDGVMSLIWTPTQEGTYALDFGGGDVINVVVGQPASNGSYKIHDTVGYEYESFQGQPLNAGDDTVHWIQIPFAIPFNGLATGYKDLYVSSNGTVSFSDGAQPGPLNAQLPLNSLQTLVAPFWDDLVPAAKGSDIYAIILGDAPHRRLLIEWWNFRHYGAISPATFQAVFYEDKPDVQFNYQNTNFNSALYNFGRSATVGIQASPSDIVGYSYNQAVIPSQKSILFSME